MLVYSCRAEIQRDMFVFLAALAEAGTGCELTRFLPDGNIPDVVFEFTVRHESTEKLLELTGHLQDIHVIRQTLRPCRIEDNSMERDFTIL